MHDVLPRVAKVWHDIPVTHGDPSTHVPGTSGAPPSLNIDSRGERDDTSRDHRR